jgi:KGK domain
MENQIEILSDNDVISSYSSWMMNSKTYVVEELVEGIRDRLTINGSECDQDWIVREDECKVLRVGDSQGWRAGKLKVRIKVVLEFEPEDLPETGLDQLPSGSESPLDRLRA